LRNKNSTQKTPPNPDKTIPKTYTKIKFPLTNLNDRNLSKVKTDGFDDDKELRKVN
jgi:hypothetical protein